MLWFQILRKVVDKSLDYSDRLHISDESRWAYGIFHAVVFTCRLNLKVTQRTATDEIAYTFHPFLRFPIPQIWECANPDADAACSFVDFVGSPSKENGGVHPSANAGAVAAAGLVAGGSAGAAAAGASKKLPEMPEGWFFQHLIMACAWSPWSGNTPSE